MVVLYRDRVVAMLTAQVEPLPPMRSGQGRMLYQAYQTQRDARVTYGGLTGAGLDKLRSAADVHVAGIRAKFAERYSDEELATLSELLGRLDGSEPDGEACTPDA